MTTSARRCCATTSTPICSFSLESLANLARNGRVKPAVAAVARMLGIRVIGQASEAGELDVLCKTRGEHGALERIVLELKEHGYTDGKVHHRPLRQPCRRRAPEAHDRGGL